jgi:hypothetical protein
LQRPGPTSNESAVGDGDVLARVTTKTGDSQVGHCKGEVVDGGEGFRIRLRGRLAGGGGGSEQGAPVVDWELRCKQWRGESCMRRRVPVKRGQRQRQQHPPSGRRLAGVKRGLLGLPVPQLGFTSACYLTLLLFRPRVSSNTHLTGLHFRPDALALLVRIRAFRSAFCMLR